MTAVLTATPPILSKRIPRNPKHSEDLPHALWKGDPIPGSFYYRAFCSVCGAPMRVTRKNLKNRFLDCGCTGWPSLSEKMFQERQELSGRQNLYSAEAMDLFFIWHITGQVWHRPIPKIFVHRIRSRKKPKANTNPELERRQLTSKQRAELEFLYCQYYSKDWLNRLRPPIGIPLINPKEIKEIQSRPFEELSFSDRESLTKWESREYRTEKASKSTRRKLRHTILERVLIYKCGLKEHDAEDAIQGAFANVLYYGQNYYYEKYRAKFKILSWLVGTARQAWGNQIRNETTIRRGGKTKTIHDNSVLQSIGPDGKVNFEVPGKDGHDFETIYQAGMSGNQGVSAINALGYEDRMSRKLEVRCNTPQEREEFGLNETEQIQKADSDAFKARMNNWRGWQYESCYWPNRREWNVSWHTKWKRKPIAQWPANYFDEHNPARENMEFQPA